LSPRRKSKMTPGATNPGGDAVMSAAARARRPGAAEPRRRQGPCAPEGRQRR
jgi:hypothetical protein